MSVPKGWALGLVGLALFVLPVRGYAADPVTYDVFNPGNGNSGYAGGTLVDVNGGALEQGDVVIYTPATKDGEPYAGLPIEGVLQSSGNAALAGNVTIDPYAKDEKNQALKIEPPPVIHP